MLLVLALTACSEFQSLGSTGYAPVETRGYGTDYWLAELHNTRAMTPEEIRQTATEWEQELNDDPSTGNRIKLAVLLTAGDAPVRNPKRARELLDGLIVAPVKSSDRELIAILRQLLDEQDQANIAIRKFKKQSRQQSQRIKELEQQLQALTDIEQNIQQRDVQPDIEYDAQ
jgi:hypothetical protein